MNPEESHIDPTDRMIRFLAGELSTEEARSFERELASGPDWEPVFRDLESVWAQTETKEATASYLDADWDGLKNRIREDRNGRSRVWIGIAASIVLLAVLWLGRSWISGSDSPMEMITFATTTEADSIRLPDGSMVWLNQGSELSYPKLFSDGERKVDLKGEAFFEVEKDPEHPFVIQTTRSEVRVLGTSFNVYERPGETQVSVATGKVSFARLDGIGGKVFLTPGEQAVLSEGAPSPEKLSSPDPNYLAWKTGTIRFKHAPLGEVVRVLEKNYGRDMKTVTPGMDTLSFRGEFNHLQLDEALELLSLSLQLSVEDMDSVILLQKK